MNITIPTSWQQLTEPQAQRIIRLLANAAPRDEIKLRALHITNRIRFIGCTRPAPDAPTEYLFQFQQQNSTPSAPAQQTQQPASGPLRAKKSSFLPSFAREKTIHLSLDAEEVACMLRELDWIFLPPDAPWRPDRIAGRNTREATLDTLPFGQYLALENLWAMYLHITQQNVGSRPVATDTTAILRSILDILTLPLPPLRRLTKLLSSSLPSAPSASLRAKKSSSIPSAPSAPLRAKKSSSLPSFARDNETETALILWISSVKARNQTLYPDYYTGADSDSSLAPDTGAFSPARMKGVTDAQIRALTKGDITKEREILELPTVRALTELNALAREYKELKAKSAR